jgi:CRISPR-associated endonuclease/helicase Cas3
MPATFWGKLEPRDGAPARWHPLVDHCADVAACCEALLVSDVVRKRLARLAGLRDLNTTQRARLCVLAALHDAGKFNHGFQAKADPLARDRRGHVRELFGVLVAETRVTASLLAALGTDEIVAWGAERLLYAAIAHHGEPVNLSVGAPVPDASQWLPRGSTDPVAGIADLARRARSWFPEAARGGDAFEPDATAFQHAFSGLVTLADWVGSDERFFPFSSADNGERIGDARAFAREAFSRLGLDARVARAALRDAPPEFTRIFEFPPRALQSAVIRLPVSRGGGVTILEAETGSGKTEAAIARFLALFAAGEVDGLYFALPTRTAATQIHSRVTSAMAKAFPDERTRPPVVLAVPGYVRVDNVHGEKNDARLPPFTVQWPDEHADRMRWRGWAAENAKRYLAGAVAVGTIDQVLLSSLPVKHAHLRASSLLRHLLVVDEVHASDAYMNRLLEEVIDRHVEAGGHVFLMSATLGSAAGARFLADERPPSLTEAEAIPYPALTSGRGARSARVAIEGTGNPKEVVVETRAWMSEPAVIARHALELARRGARVLVLRNTVGGAVETQRALEEEAGGCDGAALFTCSGVPAPHHSRYAREDRERLDAAIEEAFGKQSRRNGCVVVATQTVQQSLDLDADVLLTDLCPMDVLLQRIGRLHRHQERTRPAGFEAATAVLLVPCSRELDSFILKGGRARGPHGIGSVYPDLRILEATWRHAERPGAWRIPEMNRRLVEATTHPQALRAIGDAGGDAWAAHQAEVTGAKSAARVLAGANTFDWRQPFGDRGFATAIDGVAKTRLGAGDRVARFEAPLGGPFGGTFQTITIPAWLAGEIADDAVPLVTSMSAEGVRFAFGAQSFVYDRLGLRRDSSGSAVREEESGDG